MTCGHWRVHNLMMLKQNPTDRILAAFQRLGVSQQEALAYLALVREGGVSGYQLSKSAGIHSSKVYGILQRLADRGFVVAADTRPKKYFACPPDEVLEKIEKDLAATVSSLGQALKSIQKEDNGNNLPAWNITGRADVIHKAKEMIEASAKAIFLAAWAKELKPLRQSLTEAVGRGVDLRVVAYGPTKFDQGTVYFHRPSDYPYRERGERRFVLALDNQKALIANISENGSDNGLWTEQGGLVGLFRDFVIHEIYIAELERAYPKQIRQLVGRDWEKMRLF